MRHTAGTSTSTNTSTIHDDDTKDTKTMTSQTLDKTDETDTTGETAGPGTKTKSERLSVLRRARVSLTPKKEAQDRRRGRGMPVPIWTVFLRGLVLIADYLLAFVTATTLVPTLGAWLHQQSGAASGNLTMAGTVAMWLVPLLFLVSILAAGELIVMRGMWRWSTRTVQKIRDGRAVQAEPELKTVRPAAGTNRPSKKNKRSK